MSAVAFERSGIASWASRTDWDAASHQLLATALDRWNLTAGAILEGGVSAIVLEVSRADGSPAVLKLGYPHEEAIGEALGLTAYGPELAPRLIEQDAWTWAMLLEPVLPGISLAQSTLSVDDALAASCELFTRLTARRPPAGIPTLAAGMLDYASAAARRLPGQMDALEHLGVAGPVRAGIAALGELAADPVSPVLLHGDLNPNNILRSGEGWRVIDPKPLVGDAAYDLWPLVDQLEGGTLEGRIALAAELTGLSADRIARWGCARTALNVSWALEEGLDAETPAASLRDWAVVQRALSVRSE